MINRNRDSCPPIQRTIERTILFPRFSSFLDASLDAGLRDVEVTERKLPSLPGRRLLCGKVTVKPWCPGIRERYGQDSNDHCAKPEGPCLIRGKSSFLKSGARMEQEEDSGQIYTRV